MFVVFNAYCENSWYFPTFCYVYILNKESLLFPFLLGVVYMFIWSILMLPHDVGCPSVPLRKWRAKLAVLEEAAISFISLKKKKKKKQ